MVKSKRRKIGMKRRRSGQALVEFAEDNAIDFVVVGPEAPLAAGVADDLRAAGFPTFGPSKDAARLEASKAFTKEICDAAGAPTARWARFTDAANAKVVADPRVEAVMLTIRDGVTLIRRRS